MNRFILSVFILLLLINTSLSGQNSYADTTYQLTDTLPPSLSLFESDSILDISILFDITQYRRKRSDKEYLDAILTYKPGENDSVSKKIRVRARGEFRRNYCDFPPLMLNFRAKDTVGKEFSRINKLKMVTICRKGHEDYLLREYLTYKLYNVLTDNSYKVKLLRIDYINTGKTRRNKNNIREFAFAIEPVEYLAERTGTIEVTSDNLSRSMIKPSMLDRMAIFNYMIGNADWSIGGQHNVTVLSDSWLERPDLGVVVPYDFDYSGLVNTSYAVPGENLGIKSVRERVFLGLCREREVFEDALREFTDKKEELYRVINEFPWLKEKSKRDMIKYLDSFYGQFDRRNSIVNTLLYDCRRYGSNN